MRCELLVLTALMACAESTETDTAELGPPPAPLAEISGACPDLSSPGIKEFTSAGQSRRAGIYFPSEPSADMPVMFAWHGLSTAELMPMEQLIVGFDLADHAEEEGMVIIVPEGQPFNLLGQDVLLWGILGNEQEEYDLTLYDDLRSCVAEAFDVDLRRVSSWGHSGGGLWTSMLLMDRADTLASGVSSSGGVELEIPVLGARLPYRSPAVDVPAMLVTGGGQDVWPSTMLPIIEFEKTTDFLQERMAADGSYVVRCKHELGHNQLPSWFWNQATRWMRNHVYGQASPYEEGDKSVYRECEVI